MFFYILHIYMISISSRFVSYFMGNGSQLKHGIGLELEYVWLVSGVCLLVLTPLCKWYGDYKRKHDYWWLAYL